MTNEFEKVPDELLIPLLEMVKNDVQLALTRIDTLIPIYRTDERLYFLRGSVLAGLERYVEARLDMQKAIEVLPSYALARFQLGLLELTSGDVSDAQKTWEPLLSLSPQNPIFLFVKGLSLMISDKFEEAIYYLEEGISLNNELLPMNNDMALLVHEMREKLNAIKDSPSDETGAHFLLRQYSFNDTKH